VALRHIRDRIVLNKRLIDLLFPPPVPPSEPPPVPDPDSAPEVLFAARSIVLDGARLNDNQVTLLTDQLSQSASGAGFTLAYSQRAQDSVPLSHGTIVPDVPGEEKQPAEDGTHGFSLTALARDLGNSLVVTFGQTGGQGKHGRDETRSICETFPPTDDNPCFHLDLHHKDALQGPPGGQGGTGAAGGPAGVVEVTAARSSLASNSQWRAKGGEGGPGGLGGSGGAGAGFQKPPGDKGLPGTQGTTQPDRAASIAVVGDAPWTQALQHHHHAPAWSDFRQRQLAHLLRCTGPTLNDGRNRTTAIQTELTALVNVPPTPPMYPLMAEQFRGVVDENGCEFDLDLVPEVELYETLRRQHANQVRAGLEAVARISSTDSTTIATARDALRDALNALLASGGSFTKQNNAALKRLSVAANARDEAVAAIDRCATQLAGALGAGEHLNLPGLSLDSAGLVALVASLRGLTADVPADSSTPSGSPVSALPAAPHLIGNRARRDSIGPFEPGIPDGLPPTQFLPLSAHASWANLRTPGSTQVVDLAAVAGAARQGSGPRMARDLLVELVEAVRTWLLADLRIEQALFAQKLIAQNRSAAEQASNALISVGTGDFIADGRRLLDAAAFTADALRFHTTLAERASAIYTLDLVDASRPAYAGAFDPSLGNDLLEFKDANALGVIGSHLNVAVLGTTKTVLTAYGDRGTQLAKLDSPSAPLRFCAPETGTECGAANPEVFTRLRSDEQGFWFDASLSDVQAPHFEAKATGARVTVYFDSVENTPPNLQVFLAHQGFSFQQDLGGTLHSLTALPASVTLDLTQQTSEPTEDLPGEPKPYCVGTITRIEPQPSDDLEAPEPNFPAYGRGLAAGWRFSLGSPVGANIQQIDLELFYETLHDSAKVSLKRVEMATLGLRAGATATGRVTLSAEAPAGGLQVNLGSSDPAVLQVPASLTVPAGESSATFVATALQASGPRPPILTVGTPDGANRRALIEVVKAVPPSKNTVVLGQAGADGKVESLAVLPAAGTAPARVIATLGPATVDPVGPVVATELHLMDAALKPIKVFPLPNGPRMVAVDPSRNAIYVLLETQIMRLDATTMQPKQTVDLGFGVVYLATDPAAGLVYVSDSAHGRIHVLSADDLSTREIIGDQSTLSGPQRMTVDSAGGRLFVARTRRGTDHETASVSLIRRRPDGTHAIVGTHNFESLAIQPVAVACDPTSGLVYVSCLGAPEVPPRLAIFNSFLALRGTVLLPRNGHQVATRPGSGLAHVATQAGLVLVDGKAEHVLLTVPLGPFPFGLTLDPAEGTAYIGDRSAHSVTRIKLPKEVEFTRFA
jgi:hypothetical protein